MTYEDFLGSFGAAIIAQVLLTWPGGGEQSYHWGEGVRNLGSESFRVLGFTVFRI